MPKAIVVEQVGGPDVMQVRDVPLAEPGPGQVRLAQRAAGVNFLDVYHRSGLYKLPLPFTPGAEGAGVVDAVGPGVTNVAVGQRVVYAGPPGGYAESRLLPAALAVPLPDAISEDAAAAGFLKGMTADMLLRRLVPIGRGDKILFHAAAGGVGLIVCQLARHLGIELIGTAGGPEKCARARAAGAAHVIDYRAEDFVPAVKRIAPGGVRAAFDAIGQETFMRSLDCVAKFGAMVSFGQASGQVPPFDILLLSQKGSLSLHRPSITTYLSEPERCAEMSRALFEVMASGAVKVSVERRYPLAEAARAHRELEARQTMGSAILVP